MMTKYCQSRVLFVCMNPCNAEARLFFGYPDADRSRGQVDEGMRPMRHCGADRGKGGTSAAREATRNGTQVN